MTSIDESRPHSEEQPILAEMAPQSPAARHWQSIERLLSRLSDGLNPILVKEARQALRSRQFTITFFLMLAAGWTWSIMGLAMLGPSAYYNATGPTMFYVYYVILTAPLIVVIPYAAYSSLASERQDRTYELVSITGLEASGILWGKLCSIGMQMLIYLSALLPCLAFTYLLRGLDIFTVLLVVFYTCLLSLGLALGGLLLATLSPPRQRYVIVGVIFAVTLFYIFGMVATLLGGMVAAGISLDDPEFWAVNFSLALLYANAVTLVFLSARAQLMSPSQNRSSALRVALTIAYLSAVGWFSWAVLRIDDDAVYALLYLGTIFWFCCGLVLVGESDQLSARVRRTLPKSALGRALLSWYLPGSGTGYTFVLWHMLALCVVAPLMSSSFVSDLAQQLSTNVRTASSPNAADRVFDAAVVATSYLAIYLGLARLILMAVRRYDEVRLSIRFLTGVLLVMFLGGGPWVIQIANPQTRNMHYTLMQATNPIWTLSEYCINNGPPAGNGEVLVVILPLAGALIWALNLPSIARQLQSRRVAVPQRITEEDHALAVAALRPVGPTSPWSEKSS
jgi:hypothetical protein